MRLCWQDFLKQNALLAGTSSPWWMEASFHLRRCGARSAARMQLDLVRHLWSRRCWRSVFGRSDRVGPDFCCKASGMPPKGIVIIVFPNKNTYLWITYFDQSVSEFRQQETLVTYIWLLCLWTQCLFICREAVGSQETWCAHIASLFLNMDQYELDNIYMLLYFRLPLQKNNN